jgi:hypothetical protein
VTGRLDEVTSYDSATLERVTRLTIEPWASCGKRHWLRLVPTSITGRRVGPAAR